MWALFVHLWALVFFLFFGLRVFSAVLLGRVAAIWCFCCCRGSGVDAKRFLIGRSGFCDSGGALMLCFALISGFSMGGVAVVVGFFSGGGLFNRES